MYHVRNLKKEDKNLQSSFRRRYNRHFRPPAKNKNLGQPNLLNPYQWPVLQTRTDGAVILPLPLFQKYPDKEKEGVSFFEHSNTAFLRCKKQGHVAFLTQK